jgi:hypothetical protein
VVLINLNFHSKREFNHLAQMQNAQSVGLQLEKVRDTVPLLYERDDILLAMIQQRSNAERVSPRNMRLPQQIRPGGKAGLANMDGGDWGRSSGSVYGVARRDFFGTQRKSPNLWDTNQTRRKRQSRTPLSAKLGT